MNTLNIVAHPDDDLLFLNPDILRDLDQGDTPFILYLTTGDDGRDVTYVEMRKEAVQHAWGPRVIDRQIFWPIKSNCFRNGDKLGDLYHLYTNNTYQANDFYQSGLITQEWVKAQLQELHHTLQPGLIRIQDPFAEPAIETDGPGRDHIDHIFGAKLVVMSLWTTQSKILTYEGYPIRHREPNVEFEYVEKKTQCWRRYQAVDQQVAGAIWDIALDRCYRRPL